MEGKFFMAVFGFGAGRPLLLCRKEGGGPAGERPKRLLGGRETDSPDS